MSVRKEFTTKSGLTLPLTNLKGKEYLLAASRIQWFVHENQNFSIDTEFLELTNERAVAKVTVTVYKEDGSIKNRVSGIKTEDRKDFADYAEKGTTGALSRALSYLGYGTQFTGDELNELVNENGKEVNRLADAPLAPAPSPKSASASGPSTQPPLTAPAMPASGVVQIADVKTAVDVKPLQKSSFRKSKGVGPATVAPVSAPQQTTEGWD